MVVEFLVSGVWKRLDHGEGIREDDHLGVNGLHAVLESIGCCPRCFCFSLVIGGVFFQSG